ncbi:DUF3850 domain-containing protein [Lactococcus garvieae]|uniref:DUF3850 domain-containing protein n=1 Tax=Lactococcus garvieae TaxID=1363 RepID=UPI003853EBB1
MNIFEKKIDIKFFDGIKSCPKIFVISKKECDYQVGDILKLVAYDFDMQRYCFKSHEAKKIWVRYSELNVGCLADEIIFKISSILLPVEFKSYNNFFNVLLLKDEEYCLLVTEKRKYLNHSFSKESSKRCVCIDNFHNNEVVLEMTIDYIP